MLSQRGQGDDAQLHISIQQTAALLFVRKQDVVNLMETGILKRVTEAASETQRFNQEAILDFVEANIGTGKLTPHGIHKFQSEENSSSASQPQ